MPEVFSHAEGQLYIWSGSATASALVGYVQNAGANFVRGWLNEPRGDSTYRDVLTGQRLDVQIATYLTWDFTIQRLFQSATAVHMHFRQNSVNGSAGWFMYSGRIDSLAVNGAEAGVVNFTVGAHFNQWSAYGGNG